MNTENNQKKEELRTNSNEPVKVVVNTPKTVVVTKQPLQSPTTTNGKEQEKKKTTIQDIVMYIIMVIIIIIIILLLLRYCGETMNDGKGILSWKTTQTTSRTTKNTGYYTKTTSTSSHHNDITIPTTDPNGSNTLPPNFVFPPLPPITRPTTAGWTNTTNSRTTTTQPGPIITTVSTKPTSGYTTTTRKPTSNTTTKSTTKKPTTKTTTTRRTTTTRSTTTKAKVYTYRYTRPTTDTFLVTILVNGSVLDDAKIRLYDVNGNQVSVADVSSLTVSKVKLDMSKRPVVYITINGGAKIRVTAA